MKTEQHHWKNNTGWISTKGHELKDTAQLVLVFGSRQALQDAQKFADLREMYPKAHLLLGSTAGEIIDIEVHDNTIIANGSVL
jgi:hypothetical protein